MSIVDGLRLGIGRRMPMILQTEAAECGMACLAMISSYLGRPKDLAELRRHYGFSLKGATLSDLIRVADRVGLICRPLRLELNELSLLKTPCILHWDLNHFVVLKSVSHSKITIHDPDVGVRKMSIDEASKHFTGVAVEVVPSSEFKKSEPAPRIKLRNMLGHFSGLGKTLLQLLGFALAIEIFALASPLFMQFVVDHALVNADWDLLGTLVLGFFILLLIRTAISTMRGWMVMVLSASMKVQARSNLFSHLVHLPTSYFESRHLGDVMSRFDSQQTILRAITTDLIEVVLDGIMVGLTLFIMFVYAPSLAMLVLAGSACYGFLRWASYGTLRRASAEAIIWGAKRDSHFLETLRGIKTIKLFNAQNGRRTRFSNLLVETVNRQLTTQKLKLLIRTINKLLLGGLTILVVWLGAKRVLEGTFSVGMLLAFISYKDQFVTRVSALIDRVVDLNMLKLHGERLADIALTPPESRDMTVTTSHGMLEPVSIEVRGLCFRYAESEPWVLENVNFRIEPGESVAIAGPSGCGKTTLLSILAGIHKPTAGEIIVNNQPLSGIGIERYRSMIGVVMQDDQLFAGSIADNICFFTDTPDQDLIEASAKIAAIDQDILDMPMGYHTLIGDMGTVLSGGQKQRVLIARAVYKRPSILLLDEATSHLDVDREKQVNSGVKHLNMTRIVVAHRPETIRSAERVIILEKGTVLKDIQLSLTDQSSTLYAD